MITYIIALIIYILIYLFDKNTTFVRTYYYSNSNEDKYKSFIPRKVWFVALCIIIFFVPIVNIALPIVLSVVQFLDLKFDYNVVIKEGKIKSFIDFLNKDL